MTRRRFSKSPCIGAQSRAAMHIDEGALPPEVQRFKDTYVFERRMLERFRLGRDANYTPSASLDGKSLWDTPEERKGTNVWLSVYRQLEKACVIMSPINYVRVLFKILRGSSLAIPTVAQLPNHKMLELIGEFVQDYVLDLRQQFVSQSQRAQTAIKAQIQGDGYPLGLAVYYALLDPQTGLSPLFKYCLAVETAKKIEDLSQQSLYLEKLQKLAKEYELMAAMEYTLFPVDYDSVWGSVIPEKFRTSATRLIQAAMHE